MILDPETLARAIDRCARPGCGHERRWHAPCTVTIPARRKADASMCACPRFVTAAEYAAEVAAIADVERMLAAQRDEAARIAAELTLGAPEPAQDGPQGPITPEVAHG